MPNFVHDSAPFTFSEPCLNFDCWFERGNFHSAHLYWNMQGHERLLLLKLWERLGLACNVMNIQNSLLNAVVISLKKILNLNRVYNDNVLILWLWQSSQSFYKSDLIKISFYRQHVYICEKRRRKPWLFSMNNWLMKLEVLKKNVGDFFQIFRFNGNCLFFENWLQGHKSFVFLVSTSIFVATDEICRVWWTCREFTRLNITKRLK